MKPDGSVGIPISEQAVVIAGQVRMAWRGD
jgi:hypothetical protein